MDFFQQIASVMNSDTARRIARKTGLSKDRVYRISKGKSFYLDWRIIHALQSLGYEIVLRKK